MTKKTAVILFNLGGPDKKESIEPFLFNFFMDKNIVRLPQPLRYILAKKISTSRSRGEANDSYKELGYTSPLLENTQAQANALQEKLNAPGASSRQKPGSGAFNEQDSCLHRNDTGHYKTFVCMRYWHPMAQQVAKQVKNYAPEKIVLLPLYPQFSTTTTRSSFQTWNRAAKAINLDVPTGGICCYPLNEGFIQASAENIKTVYEQSRKDGHENPRILFSAHGLPEKIVRDGDPYQWQCERAAEKIVEALNLENPDYQICYQSRIGRLKWIGPSLDEALQKAANDKKPVIVYPHAFTQEHVETLVELDIEYKHIAEKLGIPGYYRVPVAGTAAPFIDGLAELVKSHKDKEGIGPENTQRLCPEKCGQCHMLAKRPV